MSTEKKKTTNRVEHHNFLARPSQAWRSLSTLVMSERHKRV